MLGLREEAGRCTTQSVYGLLCPGVGKMISEPDFTRKGDAAKFVTSGVIEARGKGALTSNESAGHAIQDFKYDQQRTK